MKSVKWVNNVDEILLKREAARVFEAIFDELPASRMRSRSVGSSGDKCWDLAMDVASGQKEHRFYIQVKSRVTPQTALFISEQFRDLPQGGIPVIFAPTISPRVAEIVRERGISYADIAGNCCLVSPQNDLFIQRQGLRTERRSTPAAADPFSTKSSRIVRVMLSRPVDGWKVRQLAEHPDVQVSPGLVVKVKRALIEEGYAIEHQRLLYLRDPEGMLNAWWQKYSGPAEQIPLYTRGDAGAAEEIISRWCADNKFQYALAGFSAAWRLAPEVRYNVATVYVEDRGFDRDCLNQLLEKYEAKQVETGAKAYLWRPYDISVFAGRLTLPKPEQWATSAVQTYLDLKKSAGRDKEAATAIFEKHLSVNFRKATEQAGRLKLG